MASNSLYDIIKNFEELGSQFSPVPFDYSVEFRNKYLKVSDELLKFTEFQRTLVPDMPWLSTSQIMVGTSLSAEYATPDSVDGMDEDHGSTKIIEEDSLSSEDSVIQRASKDSTNSTDINQINRAFFLSLSKRTQTFVWLLEHTDFEDGIENDVTKEVHGYIKKNEFVTYAWLNSIFANYQDNADVLAGLLRVVGMTVSIEDTDMLLPMVKAGLSAPQSKAQEAALMVIEEWRTSNCLTALETAPTFTSSWIRDYAEQIKSELVEEIRPC